MHSCQGGVIPKDDNILACGAKPSIISTRIIAIYKPCIILDKTQ
jgi:hypothetical protein